ncbi:MBL fold metallo-hydrolase [Haliovirga abyssi]|uniref:Metallo-beta-lactamase domain-containing protein n=1 Tax=Haliovirga abyssi TaxID=2996794 RepID=A0AAU9DDK9_9FUSO|nr:MBL fold metallo-hydrolase [Haliovirga abyssi]BDU50417.1 hypothetical protein HLVA_09860 [Haliovirga abyssi]
MKEYNITNKVKVFLFENTMVITSLINNNKAILIDCGMMDEAKALKEKLNKNGIQVVGIIFTHYHPDHVVGANLFENVDLICNSRYENDYICFSKEFKNEFNFLKPTKIIDEGEIKLNGFNIKIINGEGHCKSSSIILINNEIIITGDLMMQTNEGKPCIPGLCSDGSVFSHIRSLEEIIKLNPKYLIMGHGEPILNKQDINIEIEKRLDYLYKIKNSNGNIKLEDCINENLDEWELKRAHDLNLNVYRNELK